MAQTINAGRVAMVPKGEWSASTAYVSLDVVSYHGSSYVCKQDGTGQTPDTATNYWQLLSSGLDPTVDTIAAKHYEGSTVTAETAISASGVISKTASGVTKTYDLPAESGTLALSSEVAAKQDTLVSGTNIKTIDGASLLGSGDLSTKMVVTVTTAIGGVFQKDKTYAELLAAFNTGQNVSALFEGAIIPLVTVGNNTLTFITTINDITCTIAINSSDQVTVTVVGLQTELTFDSSPTTSSTNPVTSGGVKTALDTKQDTLVSGTNIKTINSASLLGSGDLTITTEGVVIVDDVTTGGSSAALSAEQGKVLGQKVNDIDNEPVYKSSKFVKSSGIQKYLAKEIVSKVDNPTYTVGAVKKNGTIDTSATTYGYVAPIELNPFETIYLNQGSNFYHGGDVACVYACDSNGAYQSTLLTGNYYHSIPTYFTNTTDSAIYIGISGYITHLKYKIEKCVEAVGNAEMWTKIQQDINTYNSEEIFSATVSETSSSIYSVAGDTALADIKNGTQLEIEVIEVGGDTALTLDYYSSDTSIGTVRNVTAGSKFYIEKFENLRVWLSKAAGSGNKLSWKIRTLTKGYPIADRQYASYLPTKQVSTINLGTPFQGYYSIDYSKDSENTITASSSWVTFPIQKTNGFTIQIAFDTSTYVVNFSGFDSSFEKRVETSITTSPYTINLGLCRGWSISVRKKNYSALTPQDASGIVTVTRTSGTMYEKPLLKHEVVSVVNDKLAELGNIQSIGTTANNALSLSKEGYGLNPFVGAPFYYHYKANAFILDTQGNKAIASQSLDDVELAARLGFRFIEANIHKTADNKFICIHGDSGKLGTEIKSNDTSEISTSDLQNSLISSLTLDYIKTYAVYDSYYSKYQTTIPTLEEFCQACKVHNIGIFAGTGEKDAVDICTKYLGNNVIIYNPPSNIRNYFNGWCFRWDNTTTTTVENILAACRQTGSPVMYGLGPSLAAQLYSDDNMDTLVKAMHDEHFLIGWTANYDSEEAGRKYLKLGMDFSSAGHEVNPFDANYEVFDIDSENLPTTTGTISNGVVTLAANNTISCGSSTKIIGKGYLLIRFDGTLTINFGSVGNYERTITSDGTEDIVISDYFFNRGTSLTITATASTTVTKFLYKTSKC